MDWALWVHVSDNTDLCLHLTGWERKGLCCLITLGLGKDIQCHVWPYAFLMFENPQFRVKLGSQPGDCKWSL